LGFIIRLTSANFLVFFAFPMAADAKKVLAGDVAAQSGAALMGWRNVLDLI
jgi:hypothetical protein